MNPNKNYILSVKGNKKEMLRALKNMIELIEDRVRTEELTLKGDVWGWKESTSGEMTAEIKVLREKTLHEKKHP